MTLNGITNLHNISVVFRKSHCASLSYCFEFVTVVFSYFFLALATLCIFAIVFVWTMVFRLQSAFPVFLVRVVFQ